MIVALGHFYGDYTADLLPLLGARPSALVQSAAGIVFNGPAAVIVFFVLSGFVIHLPQAEGRPLGIAEFYARRYLRIVPAAAIAAVAYLSLGMVGDDGWNRTVLWSIICELIYYTLYPLLIRSRVPMAVAVAAAAAATLAIALANPEMLRAAQNSYVAFGYWTWLIGAPCWLAGCWLAENYRRFPSVRPGAIWLVRLAMLAASAGLMVARFHLPADHALIGSNVVSLTLFASPVTLWLGLEARMQRRAVPVLDRPGLASYSLYLVHPVVLVLAQPYLGRHGAVALLVYLLLLATATAAFYFAVERPSHRVARWVGLRLRRGGGQEALKPIEEGT